MLCFVRLSNYLYNAFGPKGFIHLDLYVLCSLTRCTHCACSHMGLANGPNQHTNWLTCVSAQTTKAHNFLQIFSVVVQYHLPVDSITWLIGELHLQFTSLFTALHCIYISSTSNCVSVIGCFQTNCSFLFSVCVCVCVCVIPSSCSNWPINLQSICRFNQHSAV